MGSSQRTSGAGGRLQDRFQGLNDLRALGAFLVPGVEEFGPNDALLIENEDARVRDALGPSGRFLVQNAIGLNGLAPRVRGELDGDLASLGHSLESLGGIVINQWSASAFRLFPVRIFAKASWAPGSPASALRFVSATSE